MNSYDILAPYYDADMGANNPGADIAFFTSRALACCGGVLELGCGTGRITLPMVRAGCRVTGIDRSEPMLRQLQRKAESLSPEERKRLEWFHMDMSKFRLGRKYALILCPFAAFTYLVQEEERDGCLRSVREHLAPGGTFLVDAFVPRPEIAALADDHFFHDYRREIAPGRFLERTKTIRKNVAQRINVLTRNYRVMDAAGGVLDSFSTTSTIRYYHRRELHRLLEGAGFRILETFGDYDGQPYTDAAAMMVFLVS